VHATRNLRRGATRVMIGSWPTPYSSRAAEPPASSPIPIGRGIVLWAGAGSSAHRCWSTADRTAWRGHPKTHSARHPSFPPLAAALLHRVADHRGEPSGKPGPRPHRRAAACTACSRAHRRSGRCGSRPRPSRTGMSQPGECTPHRYAGSARNHILNEARALASLIDSPDRVLA
jgi:hypothetical protein